MIAIVDYGMGNLRSVQKGFERVGATASISRQPAELERCEKLVLPGVGAFRDCISEVRRLDLVEPIKSHIAAGKPFLGICLGLQLLFDVSFEDGEWPGLGIIPGKVVRFEVRPELKVPHMGWNRVSTRRLTPLMLGVPNDEHFYFVHSYHVVPADTSVVAATTDYGIEFVSMIARDRLFATQFHPEKSQRHGLQLLANFASL
jgi:glutamine amidotransferase